MNEEHQDDELDEVESVADQQQDGQEPDEAPQPESTMLTRRAAVAAEEESSTVDATDELAQLFAKPQVWGSVLVSMIVIATVWAYIDSTSNDIHSSGGWSAYHEKIVAEFTNLQLDSADEVAGVIATYESEMVADGSLPWAQLFKANLLLNKALMPDTSAPQNPLNPSGNKPSLLSGKLDLRRDNLELAIEAFNEVITAAAGGEVTLFDNIAKFRANYGIAYCEEALMIVGNSDDFTTHKSNALGSWKTTMEIVADGAVNPGLLKLVEDHYSAVLSMSADNWNEGDALTEEKFLSWLSKNDPTEVLAPEDDPLNPANIIDPRGEVDPGTDEDRESALPGLDDRPEEADKPEEATKPETVDE